MFVLLVTSQQNNGTDFQTEINWSKYLMLNWIKALQISRVPNHKTIKIIQIKIINVGFSSDVHKNETPPPADLNLKIVAYWEN